MWTTDKRHHLESSKKAKKFRKDLKGSKKAKKYEIKIRRIGREA